MSISFLEQKNIKSITDLINQPKYIHRSLHLYTFLILFKTLMLR